ncbi:helix-hairpin-helix domain-containing protein [Salinibacter altiplanensis]|uniref:helix-hairpin-helix domain-containing protein n=1 Tax=Salinibacter altiplanensis TaxID=1803181 RepID=UPI000C9F7188|nr:helix-hairpin-helix domain-containing protein [Salinibacter altiplanensis]
MRNDEVAQLLQETADLLELTGGNPHRARAFSRAARSLQDLDEPAAKRLSEETLVEASGIGDGMADHIGDIVHGGSFELRDELQSAVPPGLMDVLQVNGLGTKRTRRLWTELGIASLDELEQAAESDQIMSLDGFGAKTQQNILENVRQLRRYEAQWRLADAWGATRPFLEALRALDAVGRAVPTGALRRRAETMERADVLVSTANPTSVTKWLDGRLDDPSEEDAVVTGRLNEGLPVAVHLASPDRFGTAWWRTTGASDHCAAVTERASSPGDHPDENALYHAVGLSFVPPALREGQGEVRAAADDELPTLLTTEDLDGCLHNHSTYSDGSHTLREMAVAARDRGYSYFGICDHSQSLQIADGLPPEEVRDQHEAVARLNDELADGAPPFRVFHGIESDILRDGSLDYERELLDAFDFVVGSVHTGFSMTEDEATERLVRAVEAPHTRILGHPTGRLLLGREGYPIDHERVIEACAEHDVALELNANPHRLDLDWRWVRHATDHGVLISVNPDAHAISELDYVTWGVAVGRKGWLTPDQCLNAKSLNAFEQWLEDTRP